MDKVDAQIKYRDEYDAYAVKIKPPQGTGSLADSATVAPMTYALEELKGQVVNPVTDPLLGKIMDLESSGNINTITGSLQTTDETPVSTVIFTFQRTLEIAMVNIMATALRTGGTNGATGDSGGFVRRAAFQGVSASTPILMTMQQDDFTQRDQAVWDVDALVSGNDLYIQVTGAAGNTVQWDFVAQIVWRY